MSTNIWKSGIRDRHFPGALLIDPSADIFDFALSPSIPPRTYARCWPPTTEHPEGRFVCLVTMVPEKYNPDQPVHIAWEECGRCMKPVRECHCSTGVVVPRSVEYIYDSSTALANGEEWGISHPSYRGSLRDKVKSRAPQPPPPVRRPGKRPSAPVPAQAKSVVMMDDKQAAEHEAVALANMVARLKKAKSKRTPPTSRK